MVSFTALSLSISTVLFGLDLVSDFIYIIFLLNGFFVSLTVGTKLLGTVFIIVRFIHPFVTTFVTSGLLGMDFKTLSLLIP